MSMQATRKVTKVVIHVEAGGDSAEYVFLSRDGEIQVDHIVEFTEKSPAVHAISSEEIVVKIAYDPPQVP